MEVYDKKRIKPTILEILSSFGKRFIDTLSYIEMNYKNFSSFSDNYALLIQSIGAELDAAFKIYCNYKTSERRNIQDYINAIEYEESNAVQKYTVNHRFRNQKIIALAYNVHIQPFRGWNIQSPVQSLKWWRAFNKLKYNRFENRKLVNQGNAVNILGALYFLEMKMLKRLQKELMILIYLQMNRSCLL